MNEPIDGIDVVLVDDQALVREGIRLMLESTSDIHVAAEASDGRQAIAAVREHDPDVVLMDLRMPGMDGVEATAAITAAPHPPAVLVLTTFDQEPDVHAAFRAGARGFLLKTASADELVRSVRDAAQGRTPLSPVVARRLVDDFARRPAPGPSTPERLRALTDRELDVLRQLATGATNRDIARRLHLGESTVKTHVSRILLKLGLRDRSQAIVLGYETGLIRPGDEPAR